MIEPGAIRDARRMREVRWPIGSLIASVRRHSEVFIPRGDTIVREGAVRVVVARGKAGEPVVQLCRAVPVD